MAKVRAEAVVETIDPVSSGPSNSAVVELCNHILAGAVNGGASDMHIEPSADRISVRYRISGILEPILTLLLRRTDTSSIVSQSWQRRTSRCAIARRMAPGARS